MKIIFLRLLPFFLKNCRSRCRLKASSRVESWRSGCELYLQFPLINPYVRFSRIRLSDHLLPVAFPTPAWPSGIVSSEVPGSFLEFPASTAISFLPLFRNMMKAVSLPSPKVVLPLRSDRYYGQLRLPCRPDGISFPYIHPLLSCTASVRASRATSYGLPCVSPLIPRESTCRFWQFSLGQVLQPSSVNQRVGNSSFSLTRLPIGSLSQQPAGLLDSLIEPLSENLVLQVTFNTSLVLRRRTAEFLRLDFNQLVIRYTRHAISG